MSADQEGVVVRVAATPAEAKVLVAMLRAEGIPAFTDGDALADEVAVTRRMMNLTGVAVRVPPDRLEAAREALGSARVADDDLEAQALAADPVQAAALAAAPAPPPPLSLARILLWCAGPGLAILFLCLWLDERSLRPPPNPLFDYELSVEGYREIRRSTGKLERIVIDRNHDQNPEIVEVYDSHGKLWSRSIDADDDGHLERTEMWRGESGHAVWQDTDADGVLDTVALIDGAGKELRRQHWDPQLGFVDVR